MKKNFKSKCTCSAAGIGICLCTIFMSISMGAAAVVAVSKSATGTSNMSGMSAMATTSSSASNPLLQNVIVQFFSGFWGEVILLISFGAMIAGIWASGSSKKLVPIAAGGAAILYVSMYVYFSIPLEILGLVVIGFAYLSAFSERIAQKVMMD